LLGREDGRKATGRKWMSESKGDPRTPARTYTCKAEDRVGQGKQRKDGKDRQGETNGKC
jgi:hypothetical protein